MTDRDRLMNELKKVKKSCLIKSGGNCLACKYRGQEDCTLENIADHLIANGVIVPPCKVGDKVWELYTQYNGKAKIREGKISMIKKKADKSLKIRNTVN